MPIKNLPIKNFPLKNTENSDAMTAQERRSGAVLAFIFALRMSGLFLLLPILSIHARTLPGGKDVALVGLAIGAYGLTQMFLQMLYGIASDRFGRKPVIVFGLLLFALGSFVAAFSTDIYGLIGGRVLQGAGAISAAVTALAADLTREKQLTKVMGMIGASIGLTFAFSMVTAPLLYTWIGMSGIFWATGILSLVSILVVLKMLPVAPFLPRSPGWPRLSEVLSNPQLLSLNFGVFALHVTQTAMWVLLPSVLVSTGGLPVGEHWKVYLPAVLLSLAFMVPLIIAAEKHGQMKRIFNSAIALILIVQLGFAFLGQGLYALAFWLILFFIAFNVLEATQPSLISRLAPAHAKGAALGIYNTTQSLGLFLGGVLGGLLLKHVGALSVWLLCASLSLIWLGLSTKLRVPVTRSSAGV